MRVHTPPQVHGGAIRSRVNIELKRRALRGSLRCFISHFPYSTLAACDSPVKIKGRKHDRRTGLDIDGIIAAEWRAARVICNRGMCYFEFRLFPSSLIVRDAACFAQG